MVMLRAKVCFSPVASRSCLPSKGLQRRRARGRVSTVGRCSVIISITGCSTFSPGTDHLLFVTALVLCVRSFWDLVKVITAFTLAHSITLAISVFDLFRLPPPVVEPVIAGSIIFVALQNVFWPERTRGWTRLGVAFFFGLFHGLGFAGGLLEAMQGMSSSALLLAILGFSAGVEAGHQVVVLPIFCALKLARGWRRAPTRSAARTLLISRWGSAAISLAGMVYLAAALQWW